MTGRENQRFGRALDRAASNSDGEEERDDGQRAAGGSRPHLHLSPSLEILRGFIKKLPSLQTDEVAFRNERELGHFCFELTNELTLQTISRFKNVPESDLSGLMNISRISGDIHKNTVLFIKSKNPNAAIVNGSYTRIHENLFPRLKNNVFKHVSKNLYCTKAFVCKDESESLLHGNRGITVVVVGL